MQGKMRPSDIEKFMKFVEGSEMEKIVPASLLGIRPSTADKKCCMVVEPLR